MNSRRNGRLYQLNHCTYRCKYHLVWVTKYRQDFFSSPYNKKVLKKMLSSICKWKGLTIHGWCIASDHIHLHITIPPKYSVAYCVNILKGKSSAWLRKKTKKLPPGSIWSRGYFVSTTGVNEYIVKRYINSHGKRMKDIQIQLDLKKE